MKKKTIFEKFNELKAISGSHSPSIDVLIKELDLRIKVDACFLSNPYATDLFLTRFHDEFKDYHKLRDLIEHYPPQNMDIAKRLSSHLNIDFSRIFIGNGAIEIIQAILHNFIRGRVSLPIPTFSSYYEFVKDETDVFYYQLDESKGFRLNVYDYLSFINKNKINNVILINPNNPDGSYISKNEVLLLLDALKNIDNIIIDESFIHFAFEDKELDFVDLSDLVNKYSNLTVIKSMSKDFGVAGIRIGYALTKSSYVKSLLKNGYLWNLNGFSNYFFKLYIDQDFQNQYDICRRNYIKITQKFYSDLSEIQMIKVYPSKANFFLIKTPTLHNSRDFMLTLLSNFGIYVRDCSDKLGLTDKFVRIASRREEENKYIITCLSEL